MKAIAVDTGGTFTDMVVLDQDTGALAVLKLPSTPDEPGRAIIDGLREAFGNGVAPADVLSLSHGTTVGTNALLTGAGAHVGLFVTEGFGAINDVWHLAPSEDSSRATSVYVEKKPPVLPRYRREAKERVNYKGEAVVPLDEEAAAEAVRSLGRRGVESIAVVLLFSFLNPAHEERIAEIIEHELPGTTVSLSSKVLPQMREFPRLSTTVANAYISPKMGTYLATLEERVRAEQVTSDALYVMQSNGGVARIGSVTPVTTVLSGPCAGAMAAMAVAATAGFDNVVSLDMGGTSTDIALGQQGRVLETTSGRIGNWELAVPMLMINTIGAGGGTIATVESGGGLRVGPESAGADPGPVAYGKGGTQPTVTDANLVLGFLNPESKLAGRVSLDRDGAERSIAGMAERLGLGTLETAEGIIRIINAKMEEGIRAVSTEQGYDLRDFVLVAFGGAGPVPSGRLAADLKMSKVIVPPAPGVTSALGLLMADPRHDYVRSRLRLMSELEAGELTAIMQDLRAQAEREFTSEGYSLDQLRLEFGIDIRYLGQGYELTIPLGADSQVSQQDVTAARGRFDATHEQMFGHAAPDEEAEAVNYRLRASAVVPKATLKRQAHPDTDSRVARVGERQVCFDSAHGMASCPVYDRALLAPGHRFDGPAIVDQLDSTTVVYPGQRALVDDYLNIIIDVT
ncbi:MAG: hydantoinase/oxoprolinase family protein [Chloroflexota bacterium]|nr:hydantoinase/oxoprolinase family protein [Chloroflexota bacterium]MDE2885352.1 hydantoinase/oxoprolinase family protein [Chloroflexota bacterium]